MKAPDRRRATSSPPGPSPPANRSCATGRSSASPPPTSRRANTCTTTTSSLRDLQPQLRVRHAGPADRAAQPAGHLPGDRARRRAGGHPQLHRHPHLGQLLGHGGPLHRRRLPPQPLDRRQIRWPTSPTSTGLWRSPTRPAAGWPARARGWTSCAARSAATRGTPTSRPCSWSASAARPTRSARWCARRSCGRRPAAHLHHPGDGRNAQERRARHRPGARDVADANRVQRQTGAGGAHHHRPAVWGLGRLLRASPPTRPWGRPPTCSCATAATVILSETPETYGAEHLLTRRAVSREVGEKLLAPVRLVEGIRPQARGHAGRQPLGRQQGRGHHHHPGEVPGRRGQGRVHQPGRRLPLRRARHRPGLRVHGHPRVRPGVRHRPGGGGGQPDLLHHRARLGLRLRPSPSIKLATNSALYQRMSDDMDVNCGTIADGTESVAGLRRSGSSSSSCGSPRASGPRARRWASARRSSLPGRWAP